MCGCTLNAQSYLDPAQIYINMSSKDRISGYEIYRIGNYEVKGSPFLYGKNLKATLFSTGKIGVQSQVGYNAYDQTIQYVSNNNVLSPGLLDSFTLSTDIADVKDITFIYATVLKDSTNKQYYQKVYGGDKYSLYKLYTMDLAVVSTNYVQTDLREFQLNYDYYYYNAATGKLKKIKPQYNAVMKEFKDKKDELKTVFSKDINGNPEVEFKKVFDYLNQ